MDRKPDYVIRKAREEEAELITDTLVRPMLECEYKRPELFNREELINLVSLLISQKAFLVIDAKGELEGVIGGMLHPHPFNSKITVLSEVVWYVKPSVRGTRAAYKLFKEYLDLPLGDEKTLSTLPDTPIKEDSLNKLGFLKTEIGYLRRG